MERVVINMGVVVTNSRSVVIKNSMFVLKITEFVIIEFLFVTINGNCGIIRPGGCLYSRFYCHY